jgi:hypothetical protein
MSKVTPQQKHALVDLARRYAPEVHTVVSRGADDDVTIDTDAEAALLDDFADRVAALVLRDHPDHAGADEDVNADAELAVHMIADVVADFRRR